MSSKNTFFILTGEPGVGKTTIIKKLVSYLSEKDVKTSGFYTEEVRRNGIREGFDVVNLKGERGSLAKECSLITGPVKYKVGKYGVLVQEFETVALPCLVKPTNMKSHILVIDEIGKMEFFSQQFKATVRDIFKPNSGYIVLATIPIRKTDSLIENIRNDSRAKVWTVTRENRNSVQGEILSEIMLTINNN